MFPLKASISSAVREKALGPDMVISEVEVRTTGERRDSRLAAEPDATGCEVVVIGNDTRAFFLSFNFESALVR